MISIEREQLQDFYAESLPLLQAHWAEVANYQAERPLEPDLGKYAELEKLARLFCIIARSNGKLVGYSVWITDTHLHYKSSVMAANDVIYVVPEYRQRGLGIRLIKESERLLFAAGVENILFHVKAKKDWSAILQRMGYAVEDVILGKYGRTDHSRH